MAAWLTKLKARPSWSPLCPSSALLFSSLLFQCWFFIPMIVDFKCRPLFNANSYPQSDSIAYRWVNGIHIVLQPISCSWYCYKGVDWFQLPSSLLEHMDSFFTSWEMAQFSRKSACKVSWKYFKSSMFSTLLCQSPTLTYVEVEFVCDKTLLQAWFLFPTQFSFLGRWKCLEIFLGVSFNSFRCWVGLWQ